ncbi:Neuromedin-B receptor [Holothuria leucospilota]|uniref:Neuromedin-B receptor n=1 Tax=Holothuria leucospilota TaxID=206669 RepID=A0A9Q1GZJ3_HOLLE|nr:Neuromedin-B receptor [Holothuria leucospilota]
MADYFSDSFFNNGTGETIETVKEWGIFSAYALVLFFGVIGNFSIILLVLCNYTLQNTANILITNIAIGDFLVMVLCIPSLMVLQIRHSYPGGIFYCKIMSSVQVISACLSSLTLAALSYERYQVITNPLGDKRSNFSRRLKIAYIIIFVWTVSILLGIPVFVTTTDFYLLDIHVCQFVTHRSVLAKFLKSAILIVGFILPFFVLAFFNFRIAYCLLSSVRENRKRVSSVNSPGQDPQSRSRRKLAFIVCVMVFIFISLWLPYHIFIFVQEFGGRKLMMSSLMNEIQKIILLPPYISSAVNPWILYTMSTGYRQRLMRLITCNRDNKLARFRDDSRMLTLRVIATPKSSIRSRTCSSLL